MVNTFKIYLYNLGSASQTVEFLRAPSKTKGEGTNKVKGNDLLGFPCSEGKHLFLLPNTIFCFYLAHFETFVMTKVLGKSNSEGKRVFSSCMPSSQAPSLLFAAFLCCGGRYQEESKGKDS